MSEWCEGIYRDDSVREKSRLPGVSKMDEYMMKKYMISLEITKVYGRRQERLARRIWRIITDGSCLSPCFHNGNFGLVGCSQL